MDLLEFPGATCSAVEILTALSDSAEKLMKEYDGDAQVHEGAGLFVIYVHPDCSPELLAAANVSAAEVISSCFVIATEQASLLQDA